MSLRDVLNASDPNRNDSALQELAQGDLLNLIIKGLTPTESAVTVTSNVATLAATPATFLDINAVGGTTQGRKKLRKGPITGPQKITPATGEAVWDGATKVLFATVDAVSSANFTYSKTTDTTCSILQRDQGQGA